MARPARTNFSPAMAVSVLLHVAVFAATLIIIRNTPPPVLMGGATTVTLVNSSALEASPAVEGPQEVEATVEQPIAEADLGPVAEPTPPAPPQAKPAPTPTPTTKPPPAKAAAKPRLDLSALAGELKPSGGKGGGKAGKTAQATSPTPRNGIGASSGGQSGLAGIAKKRLEENWPTDCGLTDLSQVTVQVQFDLKPTGELVPGSVSVQANGPKAAAAAAEARARTAVGRAAPFSDFPKIAGYNEWRHVTATLRDQSCLTR